MKDSSLLEQFEDATAEAPTSRRKALQTAGKIGAGLALFSLPAFMRPKVSLAQDAGVLDVLNYALTLEYLERFYYQEAVTFHEDLFPTAEELAAFQLIAEHEASHVAFLRAAITDAGGTPVEFQREDFDYTGGDGTGAGTLDPFNDYETFLLLSQAFEDTGVSAYKGQAANLIENDVVLTAALQIHSLEARHAAEVRRLRKANGFDPDIKPWIVLGGPPDTSPIAAVYADEENTTQAGVDVTTLGYSAEAASAAFDEPLTMEEVIAIADPFSPEIGETV